MGELNDDLFGNLDSKMDFLNEQTKTNTDGIYRIDLTKVKDNKHYHCGACNKQYSVTVKTIFHDTKLPLQTWFVAIAIITNAKKGVSSLQLARDLKINQKSLGCRFFKLWQKIFLAWRHLKRS